MPDLEDLLKRLSKASGPDRELDGAIYDAFCSHATQEWTHWDSQNDFTHSFETTKRLVDERFPGCNGCVAFGEPYQNPWARLAPLCDGGRHAIEAGGATPTLALLSAFVMATIESRRASNKGTSQ